MSTAPGFLKLVKGGFVQLGPANAVSNIIAFQYNPETLVRRLETAAAAVPPPVPPAPPLAPREFATFTLQLDAADKLQSGDPLTQQTGLLPAISVLELLLYPGRGSLTVWVSGSKRIVPVQITELQVVEQAFDPSLNPIPAEITVTLTVLKGADLANNPRGRPLWDAHFAELQQLAQAISGTSTLATLGLTGI